MSFYLVQALTGLASASSLFLLASGLSLIFGVTRIVNFAHGSFYMLGAYLACSLVERFPATALGFWCALILAALTVAVVGALAEILILRRIYRAPELFQLLATFGLVLVIGDGVLLLWGAEDLLGPRAPGLRGAVDVLGTALPTYDLFLIALGPAVLGALLLLFHRTHFGRLVRAATEDREMVAALGVNEARLFTGVFLLGSFLAGLGGAVQLPREALHHNMHHQVIAEVFVVVVVGGMGSILGAFLASVLLGELNAFGILVFPQATLVLVFLVMAVVLILRPWGLLGRPENPVRTGGSVQPTLRVPGPWFSLLVLAALVAAAALPAVAPVYHLRVATEMLVFALFAASLGTLMTVGGLVSFGHAAFFGLGAYGAALLVTRIHAPMGAALLGGAAAAGLAALVFGYFCVRLTGIYFAMLTLAFAQIVYAVLVQWVGVTGGDNGILDVWPPGWASSPAAYYYLTLVVAALGLFFLRRVAFSPFGYALRATRDSRVRAEAIGIDPARVQWLALAMSGAWAGVAGALFAFLKGSVFPDYASLPVSVDALVMVLLGGVQTLTGPIVGSAAYKALEIFINRYTEHWQLILGAILVGTVVLFPRGLVGFLQSRADPSAEAAP